MKQHKETTGEYIDRAFKEGLAGLGIIIAYVFGAVFAGWLGVGLVATGIGVIVWAKKTGRV